MNLESRKLDFGFFGEKKTALEALQFNRPLILNPALSTVYPMKNRDQLLKIIAGREKGIMAALVRLGLSCMTPLYRMAVGHRNRRFDRAIAQNNTEVVKQASIPVISVGNLTTGGTGKTPLVIWIARKLRQDQRRVVLISRGYRADGDSSQRNDEAIEMEDRLADVPHLQDPDRFRMSQIAVEELESQIIVLDDGFQHRQLHRDLDIVLVDATNPLGYGRLLPRGLLREPASNLARADFIVLTRVNLIESGQSEAILGRIAKLAPGIPVATTKTGFTHLLQSDGTQFDLDTISGNPIFIFCGIGNPENFSTSLAKIDLQVCGQAFFPDHHHYTREELEDVADQARQAGATALVCTHKDLVKIGTNRIGSLPVYAILIDVEFVSGQESFAAAISRVH